MPISLSGMSSGLDTDAIITELVKAYSTKKDNLVKEQTKLEWKQDAWKTLNSKIYSFYSGSLSNLRFTSGYTLKKATSTSSKATVSAGANSVTGTQTLKIKKLAASGYLTGGVLDKVTGADGKTKKVTGSTKLKDMGIDAGSSISLTVNGKEKQITIGENTTVNNLIVSLKDAGVNASFDENNQRFFVSSKKSGEAADFSLTANNDAGTDALKKLGLLTYSAKDMSTYQKLADMDIEAATEAAYKKQLTKYTTAETEQKNLEKQIKTLNKENKQLEKDIKYAGYKADYAAAYYNKTSEERDARETELQAQIDALKEKTDRTDEENTQLSELQSQLKAVKEVNKDLQNDTLTEEDRQGIKDALQNDLSEKQAKLASNQADIATAEDILSDETKQKLDGYVEDKNLEIDEKNAQLKEKLRDFYITQKAQAEKMAGYYETYSSYEGIENPTDEEKAAYLEAKAALGLDTSTATRINGQDSEIELNGATFNSTTNNYNINGLTISVNGVTDPDETINITTETDVDAIYDKVKEFFSEYNALINEMDTLYNADSSKGYEPLTDEEKQALSDSDVEKWEAKIKDSLLRRDSTLDSVANVMKTAFLRSYEINGKKYSLSSFGIKTGGYFTTGENSKSAYHIDGDEDDTLVAGNADKLKAAIASDPDTFMSFFTKLTQGVYEELDKKMRSTTLSSAYKVYNDKSMATEYKDYGKKISEWEDRIAAYEQKYRSQFTAMEKALSQLNSKSSYLSNLLGM